MEPDEHEEGTVTQPQQDADYSLLFTPSEVAERLRLGKTKVFELLASGEIESVQIGTRRRVPRAALDRFVDSLRQQQAS